MRFTQLYVKGSQYLQKGRGQDLLLWLIKSIFQNVDDGNEQEPSSKGTYLPKTRCAQRLTISRGGGGAVGTEGCLIY